MLDFKDTNVVLFGAYGGIGASLCTLLSASSANVFATGRDQSKLESLKVHHTHTCDATDPNQVDASVKAAAEAMGDIHAVVALPGSILLKPAHSTKLEEFRATLETNLVTAFNILSASAKRMQRQDSGGSIVLMSSGVARHGYAAHEAISAAKGGIEAMARSASASYGSKGVRVNCVAPGITRTPLAANIFNSEPMLKASLDLHADKQPGEPDQVASAIAWLIHPTQRHVVGQTIAVDGGLSTVRAK